MFGWKSKSRMGSTRMAGTTGAYDGGATGVMTGMISGTRVATAIGWRDVGALQVGDQVLTFDGGIQTIMAVTRRVLWDGAGACPRRFWPLLVPVGGMENAKPMRVLPHQGVMIESDAAEEALGDPFALIPALALEGVSGIERIFPNDTIEVISIVFERDHMIYVEEGALFFCPSALDLLQVILEDARETKYQMMTEARAIALVRGEDFMAFAA